MMQPKLLATVPAGVLVDQERGTWPQCRMGKRHANASTFSVSLCVCVCVSLDGKEGVKARPAVLGSLRRRVLWVGDYATTKT